MKQIFLSKLLPFIMLVPCVTNAELLDPELAIGTTSGGSGATYSEAPGLATFAIDATVSSIVNNTSAINVAGQTFTLSSTFIPGPSFSLGDPVLFTGTFSIGDDFLTGSFENLTVEFSSNRMDYSFAADLSYLNGSLKGDLTTGTLSGYTGSNGDTVLANLGPVANPELLPPPLAPVPVPAAVWLFGSGLLGLVGIARRKTS